MENLLFLICLLQVIEKLNSLKNYHLESKLHVKKYNLNTNIGMLNFTVVVVFKKFLFISLVCSTI